MKTAGPPVQPRCPSLEGIGTGIAEHPTADRRHAIGVVVCEAPVTEPFPPVTTNVTPNPATPWP